MSGRDIIYLLLYFHVHYPKKILHIYLLHKYYLYIQCQISEECFRIHEKFYEAVNRDPKNIPSTLVRETIKGNKSFVEMYYSLNRISKKDLVFLWRAKQEKRDA